jgi:ATP/maltotriose-dependent transcriptional regulator MalT
MSTPLLATKLYIPPLRPNVVLRPRLTERMNAGLHRKLTLIAAPAGFGKTTLVSEWIAHCGRPAAWLSLDAGDSDPTRFLAYLVAALRTVAPTIGEGVLRVLQSPQPPPAESILTALLNEITALPDPFVLVLDDYHLIDATPIDQALTFLLEHLPHQLHLVITTREDPSLPLARFRARGQLSELRAADLRFTAAEAAAFLNHVMGLRLSTDDIAALESRTEGWIAGLQLAALSMHGRSDTARFIQAFTGSHRFVLDYLVEEVLDRQPERVRSFLLHTALLDRLSGPLCDAVTERADGSGMLDALERSNLFVVPLDDERRWYRYHHLFAEVLHARLLEEQPKQVSALHRRASAWYEQHGLQFEAIRHAFAAEDLGRAAGLVELAARAMLMSSQEETFLGWLKALPDELVRTRPVLSAYYAVALLSHDLEASEDRLRDAERLLDGMNKRPGAPSAHMVIVDEEEFRCLPGIAAITRAYHAGALGDVSGSVTYAQQALGLLPEDDHLWRGAAAALLGLASWTSGELETAYRSFADSTASMRRIGDITQLIIGAFNLAKIRTAQGRLREAASIYERSLKLAAEAGKSVPPPTADLYVGLSELHREQNDLESASRCLLKSKELGAHSGLSENRYRWYVAMARITEAHGDFGGALDLLDEAERLYIRSPDPYVRPVAALKTRVWVRQGRLAEALGWARERGLCSDDDLSYVREFEHITLARALIARYKSDLQDGAIHEAMSLLERLLQAADEGGRRGSVIEILVLQALAYEALGNVALALAPMKRALALAEPEGYVRIFVDEGTPAAEVLRRLERQAETLHMSRYIRRLLAACEEQEDVHSFGSAQDEPFGSAQDSRPSVTAEHVVEPLSERELEVLQLIAQGRSNREISERLFLAVSTVKGHNRMIFGKLQVKSRTEAVARARELGLLQPERP